MNSEDASKFHSEYIDDAYITQKFKCEVLENHLLTILNIFEILSLFEMLNASVKTSPVYGLEISTLLFIIFIFNHITLIYLIVFLIILIVLFKFTYHNIMI